MFYSKQDFIDTMFMEVGIYTHLHGKIKPGMLQFRPTPQQRSLEELLASIPPYSYQFTLALWKNDFSEYSDNGAALANAAKADFPGTLRRETQRLADWLNERSEADFERELITPLKTVLPLRLALTNIVLRLHVGYRMQLFLYLKGAGLSELNTLNCWMGLDAPPEPQA
jgi:hypothetical protein